MKTRLIFLHIPKCGGNTFNKVLKRNFKKKNIYNLNVNPSLSLNISKFINLDKERKNKILLLAGHMTFGLHIYLPEPIKYISIVRSPVDRVISNYFYVLKNKNHYVWRRHKKNSLSLDEYLNKYLTLEVDNYMTRVFSGMQITNHDNYKEVTEFDLKLAINNINKYFAFVGILERFDETMLLCREIVGMKKIMYYRVNVNKKRKKMEEISEKIIDKIKSLNKYDLRLYDFVYNDFQKKLDEHKINSKNLLNYMIKNKIYSNVYSIIYKSNNILKMVK